MENNDYVLAFDSFYTNNHIQILKSLLPFVNARNATMLPVLIKYMELRHTMANIGTNGNAMSGSFAQNNIHSSSYNPENFGNIEAIYAAIRRYLAPNEDRKFSQLVNMANTAKNIKDMQAMMELFDINSGDMGAGGFDINDIMKMFGGNINGDQ